MQSSGFEGRELYRYPNFSELSWIQQLSVSWARGHVGEGIGAKLLSPELGCCGWPWFPSSLALAGNLLSGPALAWGAGVRRIWVDSVGTAPETHCLF